MERESLANDFVIDFRWCRRVKVLTFREIIKSFLGIHAMFSSYLQCTINVHSYPVNCNDEKKCRRHDTKVRFATYEFSIYVLLKWPVYHWNIIVSWMKAASALRKKKKNEKLSDSNKFTCSEINMFWPYMRFSFFWLQTSNLYIFCVFRLYFARVSILV